MAVVQEGLNLKVNETSGKESFFIPFQIEDNDEDNGKKVGMFVNTRQEDGSPYKSVEKVFANVLANLGMEEAFNEKFPGDVSYLDNKVIEAMKIKLPGKVCQIKTKTTDGKVNIVAMDLKSTDHSKDKKTPVAASGKATASGTGTNATKSDIGW